MSETSKQAQARILLRSILLRASSGCAHWFEVLSDCSRPHSLAKFLNLTNKQLEFILVDAGLASYRLNMDTSANAGRLIGCSECQGPIVQKWNSRTRICCECAKQKRNTQRQDSRRDVESQAAADSKMTNLNMMKSPGKKRMMAKMENLQVENKRLKKSLVYMNKKYAKLQAALASDTVTEEPLDEDGKISDERPLKGIVEQIREQFTKTNTNDSVQTLLRVLNENLQDGERQYTDDDGKEFVESIRETIENYAKVLQNKENSLQFSPHTLRLAMSIWLKNTTAYEELRKGDTAGKWPSSSKLRKLRNATKVRSGRCGVKYERVRLQRRYGKRIIGHIMCDEFKFREGIVWNTHSHSIAGFEDDFCVTHADTVANKASAIPQKERNRHFLSMVTYSNLRRTVCGFFFYKRKDLAEFYEAFGIGDVDERYNNNYLLALDKGDLRLVSPECLDLAHDLLRVCRASIDKNSISTLGKEAMVVGYKRFLDSETVKSWLEQVRGDRVVKKYAVIPILRKVFHSRAEVEFKKFRRENTDRSVNKRKATTQREAQ